MKDLKSLAVKHDYYCHTNNYYSNDAGGTFNTWEDFYEEYHDADMDYNLVFRWDIKEYEEGEGSEGYCMEIFIIAQRKGIFVPITIEKIEESNVPENIKFLQLFKDKLNNNWSPLTGDPTLGLKII